MERGRTIPGEMSKVMFTTAFLFSHVSVKHGT